MRNLLPYILLPTDKASHITLSDNDVLEYWKIPHGGVEKMKPVYIYILSSDDINHGDYFYSSVLNKIMQSAIDKYEADGCSKIIATTNPELHIKLRPKTKDDWHNDDFINDVPKILQSDIEYIISLHNGKGKKVDVKQLASDSMPDEAGYRGFIEGFNKCSELNADKKFTEKDIMMAILFGFDQHKEHGCIESPEQRIFFTSIGINKPKRDTVMVEYEKVEWLMNINPTLVGTSQPKLKDGCITIIKY